MKTKRAWDAIRQARFATTVRMTATTASEADASTLEHKQHAVYAEVLTTWFQQNADIQGTIIKTQVTPGPTSAQLTNLSTKIAQPQSLMSKPYGAESKSQIQTLLDVTQQALDAQNAFVADHLPTLQQGIPACYGSNAEQITETS
jgi:hypothetical protein